MSSLFRRISAREEGFSLIELMLTAILLLVVMTAILSVFTVMQRASVRESARSEESDLVRVAMERITKEIRQAERVLTGSDISTLDIDTFIEGTETNVIYDAGADGRLTRTADGVTTVLLERMTTTDVFAYDPDVSEPSVITVTLIARPEFFTSDPTVITLTSEVRLRNKEES